MIFSKELVEVYGPQNLSERMVHEAQHHSLWGVPGAEWAAQAAEKCLTTENKERDDDPGGNDSDREGGRGGGSGGPTFVRKVPHSTYPNVWVVVYIPAAKKGSASVGEVSVVCDYDPDTDWPDCSLYGATKEEEN